MASIQHTISVSIDIRVCNPSVDEILTKNTAFLLGGFFQALGRILRKNVRPFALPSNYATLSAANRSVADRSTKKRVYDILSIISVQLALNFTVMPFLLLELKPTLKAWHWVHFYGLYICFVPLAFFRFGGGRQITKALKDREQKAGISIQAVDQHQKEAQKAERNAISSIPDIHAAPKDK